MTYILEKLEKELGLPPNLRVETPPAEVAADLAIPCFKENPQQIAEKIKKGRSRLVSEVKISGKYVNLILNKNKIAEEVFKEIKKYKDKYGFSKSGGGKKIIIEYSSPNIAKPMHVGHLRNTTIGNSLAKIHKALGYKVISANYIGDWGAHFGLLLLGLVNKYYRKKPKNIEEDGELYAKMANLADQNPAIKKAAAEFFKKLEDDDKKLLVLWRNKRANSLKEFKKIYKELGASFNDWHSESFYKDLAKKAIEEALEKKVAKKSDGAVAVDLEKYGLRSYLLQKSDGATLYSARDLAAAKGRLKKYKPEKILYVVGREQELYLKQVFKTLELLGYPAKKFEHVSYNIVTIRGKKASTRAGRIVFAKDIIEKAVKKTKGVKKIALGGVIYNLLSQSRRKTIEFSWNKITNLKGDSGPYIQYGYTRAKAILKKASPVKNKPPAASLNQREGNLVMLLAKYPLIVKSAGKLKEPHLISNYLNNLVQEFNRFYETIPVLKAKGQEKLTRLALVETTAQVIKNGLGLLGIETPNKM